MATRGVTPNRRDMCGLDGDVGETLLVRVDVDRGIPEEHQASVHHHEIASDQTERILVRADDLERWPEHISVIPSDSTDQPMSITSCDHCGCEMWAALQEPFRIDPRDPLASTLLMETIGVCRGAPGVVPRVERLVFERQTEFLDLRSDPLDRPEEDGEAHTFITQPVRCANDLLIITLNEHDASTSIPYLIHHAAHHGIGETETSLERGPIDLRVERCGVDPCNALLNGR